MVWGKPAWAITHPPARRTFAAPGSSLGTGTTSTPSSRDASNHSGLARTVSSSIAVTADLRCRQPVTRTGRTS